MSLVRIGWTGDLGEQESEVLNDLFNLMGLTAACDAGLISQEELDKETARLDEKYKDVQ